MGIGTTVAVLRSEKGKNQFHWSLVLGPYRYRSRERTIIIKKVLKETSFLKVSVLIQVNLAATCLPYILVIFENHFLFD